MSIEFFERLPEATRQELKTGGEIKNFARGTTIYRQGDTPKGVYFIQKGLVGLVAMSDRGTEHLLRFFRQGEYFGHRSLLADESYHASSQALQETEVIFLSKTLFFQVIQSHADCMLFLTRKLAVELGRAEGLRISVSEKDVMSRTAEAVIYLKGLKPDHLWTRKEIADFCSSTTPTVIRALGQLERKGLIRQDGRRIEILDSEGLLEL